MALPRTSNAIACLVSPNATDAELAVAFLRENGIEAGAYSSLRQLAPLVDENVGCIILVEDALVEEEIPAMREALARLPAWCDMPLLIVSRDVGSLGGTIADAFPSSGNVTLLERPLNPHTLVSAAKVALRGAARQREVGELITQRDQAVKLRDEFLAMLAHELRNPLAPMSNAVYLLRELKLDNTVGQKSVEILERQIQHVVRMVDDLMDVARLERGKVVLKKQRVDLNRVVASAAETSLPAARERGQRINLRFGAGALPVEADPVRLEQIVCNLVNNAAKFSPPGDEISVETADQGGFALVTVEDQGMGFEPEAAERLFAPFLQINPTLERSAGGLGMGLTIVRRLVELHGGSVHAASAGPGKGARFVVRIPLAAGVHDAAVEHGGPEAATSRRRVVVIEDNPDIRETMRMLLHHWGHEVSLASEGRTGLELVLHDRPDVALVDVGLPGMSGYDVAREIRMRIPNGTIRLIAITGYGQPADRELALQAGFDAHVLKPIAPQTLERLLAE